MRRDTGDHRPTPRRRGAVRARRSMGPRGRHLHPDQVLPPRGPPDGEDLDAQTPRAVRQGQGGGEEVRGGGGVV
eukprot:jgi/Chlat1/7035/Chrsp56S06705